MPANQHYLPDISIIFIKNDMGQLMVMAITAGMIFKSVGMYFTEIFH